MQYACSDVQVFIGASVKFGCGPGPPENERTVVRKRRTVRSARTRGRSIVTIQSGNAQMQVISTCVDRNYRCLENVPNSEAYYWNVDTRFTTGPTECCITVILVGEIQNMMLSLNVQGERTFPEDKEVNGSRSVRACADRRSEGKGQLVEVHAVSIFSERQCCRLGCA